MQRIGKGARLMGHPVRRIQEVDDQGRVIIPGADVGLRPGEKVTVRVLPGGAILLRRIAGRRERTQGVVDAAAGMFKDRPEAVEAILESRVEDDRDVW